MFDPRNWQFVADMNYSGSITITDVWLWFKWLYFYPGDAVVYFLIHKTPTISNFFEMSFDYYYGVFSGVTSFFVWLIVLVVFAILVSVADRIGE